VCVYVRRNTHFHRFISLFQTHDAYLFIFVYIYTYINIDRWRPPPAGGVSNVPSLAVEWILVPEVHKLVCFSVFFSLTMRHTYIGRDFSLSHHRRVSLSPQTFLSLTTFFSFSRYRLFSLSLHIGRDFPLSHYSRSLSLFFSHSLCLALSLSLSFARFLIMWYNTLSIARARSLSLSLSLSISLSLSLSLFLSLSLSLSLSFSLSLSLCLSFSNRRCVWGG